MTQVSELNCSTRTSGISARVRVGVIGGGFFAQYNHIPCLLARPDVYLAWILDQDPNRLNAITRMYGVKGVPVSKLDGSLSEVDVVLLSVPYGVRAEYYDLCARLGCHVYVEKPFARSIAEHDDIAARFSSGAITVGFNRRYYKNLHIIKQVIADRMFGALRDVAIRQGFFSLSGMSGFRSDARLSGGGVLIESGIHLLDSALEATCAEEIRIDNVGMVAREGIDYHTEATGRLVHGGETASLSIEISCLQNFSSGIWFGFDGAVLHYPMSPQEPVTLRDRENRVRGRLDLDVGGARSVAESLQMIWQGCLENRRQGGTRTITPDDARLTSGALEALYAGAAG